MERIFPKCKWCGDCIIQSSTLHLNCKIISSLFCRSLGHVIVSILGCLYCKVGPYYVVVERGLVLSHPRYLHVMPQLSSNRRKLFKIFLTWTKLPRGLTWSVNGWGGATRITKPWLSIKMKRKPVYDMTSPAYECDSCEKCTLFKMIG